MKILIVEDDEDILNALGEALCEDAGNQCLKADTVEEGLQLLVSEHPEFILLDLKMRDGGNALDLIEAARRLYEPPPRIVLISACRGLEEIARANKVEWLSKPFDLDALYEKVRG